jgi:cell division protein FtsW
LPVIVSEVMAIGVLAVVAPYRMARIAGHLDPWKDPTDKGFHTIQALLALGSGGIIGVGPGEGRQKFLWLPAAHTDTIFAVIGEEWGFVGSLIVLLLFLLLCYRGLRVALRSPDAFSSLAAAGIVTWITVQALANIAVVSALIPFTGIPLPFMSYGGSSLVINLASIGLVLGFSRYRRAKSLGAEPAPSYSIADLRAP